MSLAKKEPSETILSSKIHVFVKIKSNCWASNQKK